MKPDAAQTVLLARAAFDSGRTRPLDWRAGQLEALRRMLTQNEQDLAAALRDDLGKSATESWMSEIGFLTNEIRHTQRHLRQWLAPQRVSVPAALRPARSYVVREPLGVVLVIAPWNYPLQLTLAPLVGALAGGNAVVLKPSELAPATSAAIARLVPAYLDPAAVHVVQGGADTTTALLEQRLDHIFYTGNGHVGRIVHAAATRHLTPVTLELGGKSPVFVDDDVDIETTARRIAWGKWLNAGQTCVAPDYVLASRPVLDRLVPALQRSVTSFFGPDPSSSPDLGRIVNDRHFERIHGLLEGRGGGRVVIGGESNAAGRYVAPTVLDDVGPDDPVMQEEIFGPVLPLVQVEDADAAVRFVSARDKPLALYVFTESADTKGRFLRDTSSGALGFGIPLAHLTVPGLPFGGVGESGLGSYHGEDSVRTFTHARAVLDKPLSPDTMRAVYPPFGALKDRLIRAMVARAHR